MLKMIKIFMRHNNQMIHVSPRLRSRLRVIGSGIVLIEPCSRSNQRGCVGIIVNKGLGSSSDLIDKVVVIFNKDPYSR